MICEHEYGASGLCTRCKADTLAEAYERSRAREARLREALERMRTVFAQNRHAQEWADWLEQELASSAVAPAESPGELTAEQWGKLESLFAKVLNVPGLLGPKYQTFAELYPAIRACAARAKGRK